MAWTEGLLKAVLTGLIILVLGTVVTLFLVFIRRWLTVRADKEHSILLSNRGNCRSLYYLTASSPEPGLAFTFLINKIPLVEGTVLAPEQMGRSNEVVNDKKSFSTPAVNTSTTSKSLQKAGSKAGTVAAMLGTIASFLPGELGNRLRDQAAQMRSIQVKSARASQAPAKLNRKIEALQKNSGVQGQPSHAVVQRSESVSDGTVQTIQSSGTDFYCAQTGELLPGESVSLTLSIGKTHKQYPVGSFNYTIHSQQVALDFPDSNIPPLSRNGTVYFAPIGRWRYWLLPLMNCMLVLLALATAIYSLLLLWQ